jgi:hypothetical protein
MDDSSRINKKHRDKNIPVIPSQARKATGLKKTR